MIKITVGRHSFFETPKGNLRFSERSPKEKEECPHQVCSCTKVVTKRPTGKPSQVNEYATIESDNLELQIGLQTLGRPADNHVCFTFVLPQPTVKPLDPSNIGRPHAYFWFSSSTRHADPIRGLDVLNVEITKPGHEPVDHFFGHVFYGNQVNTKDFINGHSPSRIVDLELLKSIDIWCHECRWGQEAMTVFSSDKQETNNWRGAFNRANNIRQRMLDVNPKNLNKARAALENDKTLLADFEVSKFWFESVLKNLEETALFKNCEKVRKEADRLEVKAHKREN